MTMCNSTWSTPGGSRLSCTLQEGHELRRDATPHAAMPTGYRWDRVGNGWLERPGEEPITAVQDYVNRQQKQNPLGDEMIRTAQYSDNTPCGAGGYFNNNRVTCSRDHGHFGPHRAILNENGYNIMRAPDSSSRSVEHKLAVIWESR